jgi:hypothetical protein
MKLTLSLSGGYTGLTKENTIDLSSLDESTRSALLKYFRNSDPLDPNRNIIESWSLDDKEIPVKREELPAQLQNLYKQMKKDLKYDKE